VFSFVCKSDVPGIARAKPKGSVSIGDQPEAETHQGRSRKVRDTLRHNREAQGVCCTDPVVFLYLSCTGWLFFAENVGKVPVRLPSAIVRRLSNMMKSF
jgi:hypothetical protein